MRESTDPDLILRVTQETLADGRRALKFVAKTRETQLGLYLASFDSAPFHGDPEDHFRELFRDISKVPRTRSEEWLAGRGAELFEELLPVQLQHSLWALRGLVRTVQILSDEVWIPWELLRLQEPDDLSAGPFLVEAFSVTRWPIGLLPILDLPMKRIALVVPKDSDLPDCRVEGDHVKTLGGAARAVVEIRAIHQEVVDALASGLHDGWHFSGHGLACERSPHRWSLLLEQEEELTPADLRGRAHKLGLGKPLIFLNSCQSGRGATSLSGLGGLASAFLKAGAGAFLGSYWELGDHQACCFAKEFYKHLVEGQEIGEAVRQARLDLRKKFPSGIGWLAYTVFAHPLARCSATPDECRAKVARIRRASRKKREVVSPPNGLLIEEGERSNRKTIELVNPQPEQPAGLAPGAERIHEKDGTILVYVPGGELMLGAEGIQPWSRPVHRVRLNPFWIGKFPVTNEQFSRFLKENPSFRSPAFWEESPFNKPRHPVVGLSWGEAQAYCLWAGLELPSEAQWEAAARGTDQRPYPWGKQPTTTSHANFGSVSGGTASVDAHPAGVGPYGTFDQAGNVWEWCADPWASRAYQQFEDGQCDPIAKGETAVRALRGGSWENPAQDLHAAYRDRGTAKLRFNNQGFRCVWRSA